MADTREPSPRSRRTKQGSKIPSKKTQAEIDAAKEGAKKARKIIEERGNVKLNPPNELRIQRDLTTQQGINRDVKENQTGDQILDPEGNFKKGVYKRPSLEQLKRRAALGISTAGQVVRSANPTATALPIATGALSLMIKGLQGQILRGY